MIQKMTSLLKEEDGASHWHLIERIILWIINQPDTLPGSLAAFPFHLLSLETQLCFVEFLVPCARAFLPQ